MVFKQSFKYLKNGKINFIKVILKLECMFYQNIYIYYLIIFYIRRAILTQTNPKKGLIEKKTHHILYKLYIRHVTVRNELLKALPHHLKDKLKKVALPIELRS